MVRKGRTTALVVVVALLALSMLGGHLFTSSLKRGLNSLETRLGADVLVVADDAGSQKEIEAIFLDGVPGSFYMDRQYYDEVAKIDGIDQISAQYYLATASSGCCSLPIQVIGFDPKTDFTVTPWIKESKDVDLELFDVVAGYNVNRPIGSTVTFFDQDCRIVAKLDKTGTELDNVVYTNYNTVKKLLEASKAKGYNSLEERNPDEILSSILIKVKEGEKAEHIANEISIKVKGVRAVPTKNMLSGVSDSLAGTAKVIRLLMIAIWILAFIILLVVFSSMINERKKEFAVLRVCGTSQKKLSELIMKEAGIIGLIGDVIGIVLTLIIMFPFNSVLENALNLPFLLPKAGGIITTALIVLIVSVIACAVASAYSAYRLSKVDVGIILREGN